MICDYCYEEISSKELPFAGTFPVWEKSGLATRTLHDECQARMSLESVGHLLHVCSCYGGSLDDPPFLTTREVAKLTIAINRQLYQMGVYDDVKSGLDR